MGAHGDPVRIKATERISREDGRRAAMPSRENAAHGPHRCGRGNVLNQRAQAHRRHFSRWHRLLGQELADGTIVLVGRMRGGNARPWLILAGVLVMVVKQRGRRNCQHVAGRCEDRESAASHHRHRSARVAQWYSYYAARQRGSSRVFHQIGVAGQHPVQLFRRMSFAARTLAMPIGVRGHQ
jgi:hypothetical protein